MNEVDIDDLRYLCLHLIYLCIHFNYRLLKMSDITEREFAKLALDDNNYLTWAFDAKIHLTSFDLSETIVPDSECNSAQKVKELIFLHHHFNQDLKNKYLTKKYLHILWQSLKDRFHQQTNIILPQAQYD